MKMDLKEIIKWFIPCFHILLFKFNKMDRRLTFVCLFLFFNSCPSFGAKLNSFKHVGFSQNSLNDTKKLDLTNEIPNYNQSEFITDEKFESDDSRSLEESVGRTFGRPFKKMMAGLLPLVFQIGAASTWAVVAALVGVKTLAVTLVILKVLLLAGAVKVGALFASKGHHQTHGWDQGPHQKEIHLHIHNGHLAAPHEEHSATWSRSEILKDKNSNVVLEPYAAGPQTINTPFGNYVKVD